MAQPLSSDQLRGLFEQTLSPHAEIRKAAETHIVEATKIDGHVLSVLRHIETEDIFNAHIRQAAAVHFKNCIKKAWDTTSEDGNDGIIISLHDRALIKENLVVIISDVPPDIQSQCWQSIRLIAAVDFPANWDSLLPMLVHKFSSNDALLLNDVLYTVNSLFQSFRCVQRSDKLYADILYSLRLVQEPMLKLFKSIDLLLAVDVLSSDTFQLKTYIEALRLVSRIYFSLNYEDLPEFFEDTMGEWMAIFAKYLEYQNPLLTDPDERLQPSPIDKLQVAIVENIQLYTDEHEESFLPYLPTLARLVWKLLMRITSWSKHDDLATKCIRFLTSLVKKKVHRDLFKDEATLRQIIGKIVIPNLMIREVDQECFDDDPTEFIASDIEGSEIDGRRKCSHELLRAICRQFEQEAAVICRDLIEQMMILYHTNPRAYWTLKVGAINLMFAASLNHGVPQANEIGKLKEFFYSHVIPELQDREHCDRSMLKSTSLKFVCAFRNQFTIEQLVALIPVLIFNLSSPSIVVHSYSAFTIEKIMTTKNIDVHTALRPFLQPICISLLELINIDENEHAMKCVMRILIVGNDDVLLAVQAVLGNLTSSLARVAKYPRNPRYNHWLFESVAVLIKSVCSVDPNATSSFEGCLFPCFRTILQEDVTELTGYVFQIFAQLLDYQPRGLKLGGEYTDMLHLCLNPVAWECEGNIPALTRLLRAFLHQDGRRVIISGGFMPFFFDVWPKLVSTMANEQLSFALLTSLVGSVHRILLQQTFTQIFTILFARLQSRPTPRFIRLTTNFFAFFVIKCGSQCFFQYAKSMQDGPPLMIEIWLARIKSDPPGRMDSKLHETALYKVCSEIPALMWDETYEEIIQDGAATVWSLLISDDTAHDALDDCLVEMEITSDWGFLVLDNARQPVQDPFIENELPRRSFAQMLGSLHARQLSRAKKSKKAVTFRKKVKDQDMDSDLSMDPSQVINRRVAKYFDGQIYFGTVRSFDPSEGFWKIDYDDGDEEEFDTNELQVHLRLRESNEDMD
ncbi:CAS/CSE protein [Fragilaria crotonensis]|nr:CAS/CSE protein [Fragilaria crotonensis]